MLYLCIYYEHTIYDEYDEDKTITAKIFSSEAEANEYLESLKGYQGRSQVLPISIGGEEVRFHGLS